MGGPDEALPILDRLLELRGPAPAAPKEDTPKASEAPAVPDAGAPAAPSAKPRIPDVTALRRMDGMTPALYRRIAPHLTVYGRDGRINPFHAPRGVLEALPGLSELDVDRFLASKPPRAEDDEPIPASLGKAGALLANRSGPAYIISVAVGKPGRPFLLGRQYVIATGLDGAAAYRLLATRPLSADSFTPQDRAPQS
jgi:general secretion pathway protein K